MGGCLSSNNAIPSNKQILSRIDHIAATTMIQPDLSSEQGIAKTRKAHLALAAVSTPGERLRNILLNKAKESLARDPSVDIDTAVKKNLLFILTMVTMDNN